MQILQIEWKEKEIRGWTDLVPLQWFEHPPKIQQTHLLLKRYGVRLQFVRAYCIVSANNDLMILDYSRPNEKSLNDAAGVEIGIMKVSRTKPYKTFWKSTDGQFEPADVKVKVQKFALPEYYGNEGNEVPKTFLSVTRDQSLRYQKILFFQIEGKTLSCIACGFDFEKIYGKLGQGFCEIHHKRPLAKGGSVKTGISDVDIVCSNCHSMIHRRSPVLTTKQLTRLIKWQERMLRGEICHPKDGRWSATDRDQG